MKKIENRRRILENGEEIDKIASELKISHLGCSGCLVAFSKEFLETIERHKGEK